jgi:probable HAF family extracellular repeat protein
MKKHVVMALGLAWIAVFCLAGSSEAVKFRYENLGTLSSNQTYTDFDFKEAGINDAAQVAGISPAEGGVIHAFVKSPGQAMVDLNLGLPPGSGEGRAKCINNSGVVGGYFHDGTGNHACVWVPSGGQYLWSSLGGINSQISDINDAGDVAGMSDVLGNSHAYVKPKGGTGQDLGMLPGDFGSWARGINNSQTIVGYSYASGGISTACFWSPSGGSWTAAAPLFGVADSKAFAINNLGHAVGVVAISGLNHAVLKPPAQELQYLGGLNPIENSLAYDINDSGWVVGYTSRFGGGACLWTPFDGKQDLNQLVVNLPEGVWLVHAMAINKRGEIAGYMSTDGSGLPNGVFKLTPISSLPTSLLLLD